MAAFNSRNLHSCIIPGDSFQQWYFIVFAFPSLLVLLFALVIPLAYATTKRGAVVDTVRVTLKRSRHQAVCENALKHEQLFSLLSDKERHQVATLMPPLIFNAGDDIVRQGHKDDCLHIILEGTCEQKVAGQDVQAEAETQAPVMLKPGECFGNQEQLRGRTHWRTVTAWPGKCTVATLTGKTFSHLNKRFAHVGEFVAMFEEGQKERKQRDRRSRGAPADLGAVVKTVGTQQSDAGGEEAPSGEEEKRPSVTKQLAKAIEESHAHSASYAERMLKEEEEMNVVDDLMVSAFQSSHRHIRNGGLSRKNRAGQLHTDGVIVVQQDQRYINHSCCGGALLKLASYLSRTESIALSNFYTACFDRRAQKRVLLEMSLTVYGPALVEIPSIILCDNEVNRLETDPSIECGTAGHQVARVIAVVSMFVLVFGLPAIMFSAARSLSWMQLTSRKKGVKKRRQMEEHAEEVAKAKFVLSWNHMTEASRQHEVDKCLTDLHNQEMGAEIW